MAFLSIAFISPHSINSFDWKNSKPFTSLTVETIQSVPDFDPGQMIKCDYEEQIHKHYGVKPYWE